MHNTATGSMAVARSRRTVYGMILGVCSSAMAGCGGAACENSVIDGFPAPDGAAIAFVFRRTCGEAHAVSTNVSVIAFREPLRNEEGNVLAVEGEQQIKISWRGPKILTVGGFHDSIYRRTQAIDSVVVDFN